MPLTPEAAAASSLDKILNISLLLFGATISFSTVGSATTSDFTSLSTASLTFCNVGDNCIPSPLKDKPGLK